MPPPCQPLPLKFKDNKQILQNEIKHGIKMSLNKIFLYKKFIIIIGKIVVNIIAEFPKRKLFIA
jgi:hypothetical protein